MKRRIVTLDTFIDESYVYTDKIKNNAIKQYSAWKSSGGEVGITTSNNFTYEKIVKPGMYTVVEGDMDGRYLISQFTIKVISKMNPVDLAVQIAQKTGYVNPWGYLELRVDERTEKTSDKVFPLEPTLF